MLGGSWALRQEKTKEMWGVWDTRFMGQHELVVDPTTEYALEAIPALDIEGKLVDDDGKPVRGRRVELQETRAGRMPAWMTMRQTTSDGALAFRGVYPLPDAMRVALGAQGTVACEPFVAVGGQDLRDLVLRAVPLGTIEDRLCDGQGQPLIGARVWLRNWSKANGQQIDGSVIEILSNREGRYRFIDVEPGSHRLEVYGLGDDQLACSEAFDVEPGATATFDFDTKQ